MKRLITYLLWPGLVIGSLGITAICFGAGVPKMGALAAVYISLAILVGVIERILPHNRDWNAADGQLAQDLGHSALGSLIAPRIGDGAALLMLATPQVWLANAYGGGIWPTGWPMVAQACLAVLLGDIGGYWAHRISHTIPFLWRFHALHHSPGRLYFVNTGRFHPVDSIQTAVMIAPILILLGATAEVMLWQIAVTNYIGVLSHCNIEMRFGFLNYLFNTPGVHRWHHSRLPEEADNNYGENVMVYDVIFGTHLNPDRPPPTELGIKAEMPKGFLAQLLSPIHFTKLEAEGARLRALEADEGEAEAELVGEEA